MRDAQRALIRSSFVNRVGSGLFNATSTLYFTRVVHLPAAEVGAGLTIAGLVGLLAGVPVGHLADRYGPRLVTLLTLCIQAGTMASFVLVRSWAAFTLLATLDLLAASANNASRGALIARVGGDQPAVFRARLRNYVNLGLLLGTVGAAVAIQVGSRSAYTALILVNTASYLIGAMLLLRVPGYAPLPADGGTRNPLRALADRPFLAVSALNGAMGLQYQVVALLLPIWISSYTDAPRWTVAAVYGCNAALCIALQVRIGSTVETIRQGGHAFRRAGVVFLLSCPLMALAADVPRWEAVTLLLIAVCVHSVGEVLHSSAGFVLGFGLAPDHAQGQYQGLVGLGFDAGQAVAPAFLTGVCLALGQWGWLLLGALLAVLGLLGPPVAGWAGRSRPADRPADCQAPVSAPSAVPGQAEASSG
ncbi:MFS transporter [Streptomyces sp. NPDC094038]|uniref:MFS transporter n=1 Tax=Streptomyces sp. NPDC094038 TaxID=3366055 RepID=UPI00380E205D